MPKSTPAANKNLLLLFNAVTWDGIAKNDTTSPVTSLYLSLHITSPGVGGDQTTGEATYGGYARLGVIRSAVGWTVVANAANNAALAQFVECVSGAETITHVAIGTNSSGSGLVLYQGALGSSRAISAGITPQFAATALSTTES